MKIGIIGAGFVGRALARHALQCGHAVMVSNSRGPQTLSSTVSALQCLSGTAAESAAFGDLVMLALPFHSIHTLPASALRGKVVVDATNYYPNRDGIHPELERGDTTTSQIVAQHLPEAKVVKAFNAILATDLEEHGRARNAPDRRALPIAGDDVVSRQTVAALVDAFGFDALDCGSLEHSWKFERARPGYCVPLGLEALRNTLQTTQRHDFVAEYAWHRKRAT